MLQAGRQGNPRHRRSSVRCAAGFVGAAQVHAQNQACSEHPQARKPDDHSSHLLDTPSVCLGGEALSSLPACICHPARRRRHTQKPGNGSLRGKPVLLTGHSVPFPTDSHNHLALALEIKCQRAQDHRSKCHLEHLILQNYHTVLHLFPLDQEDFF